MSQEHPSASNAHGSGVLRLLAVMPSWLGDCVMATPTLRRLRRALPGVFIGALLRPALEELFHGADFFDEVHAARSSGVMGPKFVAAKVRPRRYDVALLLTNSFSTALITRIAGIPRRIGYDRDARGLLLTHRLAAPTRADGSWAPISAVSYYWHVARALLEPQCPREPSPELPTLGVPPEPAFLELSITSEQHAQADAILARAGLAPDAPMAILNPGGNNPAKRWPADRFAALARHLHQSHGLHVLVNGSPDERELCEQIVAQAQVPAVALPALGGTIGTLKSLVGRSRLMVTNDTGPRHIAAALGVPLVSLFGPTDHRWTTIPTRPGAAEIILLADPALPETELANDHPERCRIDRIPLDRVVRSADQALQARKASAAQGS